MHELVSPQAAFPHIEVVDDTWLTYKGPLYRGCALPRTVRKKLVVGRKYVCSIFAPSARKPPLLFMCILVRTQRSKVKVIMAFYPHKPEHDCRVDQLVSHLLDIIDIHNETRVADAVRKTCL